MIKKILLWIGVFFFGSICILSLIGGGYVSALLFLLIALLCSPLWGKVTDSLPNSLLKAWVPAVIGVSLFIVGCICLPSVGTMDSEDVDESVVERSSSEEKKLADLPTTEDELYKEFELADNPESSAEVPIEDSNYSDTRTVPDDTALISSEEKDASDDGTSVVDGSNDHTKNENQPSVEILTPLPVDTTSDTTDSVRESETSATADSAAAISTETNTPEVTETEETWVLNINTMKIHYPTCNSVTQMKEKNKRISHLSLEELLANGYSKCKNCFK